jgi:hypothetical protein
MGFKIEGQKRDAPLADGSFVDEYVMSKGLD